MKVVIRVIGIFKERMSVSRGVDNARLDGVYKEQQEIRHMQKDLEAMKRKEMEIKTPSSYASANCKE